MALSIAMLADYLLTYIGIQAGKIVEGNPLMLWLMGMPLWAGLACRIIMVGIICGVLQISREQTYYARLIKCLTGFYSLIFIFHIAWIAR